MKLTTRAVRRIAASGATAYMLFDTPKVVSGQRLVGAERVADGYSFSGAIP